MTKKIHYWTGFCNESRTPGIEKIGRIIGKSALIANFQFFSDISLSLTIETEEFRLPELFIALNQVVHFENALPEQTVTDKECVILLNVTFVNSSGDFKTDVPAIPG